MDGVDGAVSWPVNCFNQLIICNNRFRVNDPFMKKPVSKFAHTWNWKLSQSQILSKDTDTFLKISFFLKYFSS